MAGKDLTAISRTLSHALRHEPLLYELELDAEGWTPVEAVLAALGAERSDWQDLTADDLDELIATLTKPRHEMADGRIRALYGHSVPGSPWRGSTCIFRTIAPARSESGGARIRNWCFCS